MSIPSVEEESMIKSSIKEYQEDMSVGFDKIQLQLYEYTYRIAFPVFRTEENSRHVTEHILKRLEQRIDEVDLDNTFYPWYAKFCCYRIYRIISNRKGNIYHKDKYGRTYQFNSIKDDFIFKEVGLAYLNHNRKQSESREENHSQTDKHRKVDDNSVGHKIHLHIAQRLMLEMYVALELDVEEIAELCHTRKSYVSGELAGIRASLMGESEEDEPGFVDLLCPKLSKKVRLMIDLASSVALIIVYMIIFIL